MVIIHVACRYEELEAITVSNKLSQLDTSEKKEEPRDTDNKTDVTSADSQAVSSEDAGVKNDNKILGIFTDAALINVTC